MTDKEKKIKEWKDYNIFLAQIRDNLINGNETVLEIIKGTDHGVKKVLVDLHIMDYINSTQYDDLRQLALEQGVLNG